MKSGRIELIQAFRGIAALLVVFYHASSLIDFGSNLKIGTWLFGSGAIGVDMFFIISGFIMVYTTQNYDGNAKFVGSFFVKRFFRVWPTYVIITLLFIIINKLTIIDYSLNLTNLFKSLSFIPLAVIDTSGSAPFYGYSVLSPGWTLNYEMYFYLIFGLSLFFRKYRWVSFFIYVFLIMVLFPVLYGVFSFDAYSDYQFKYIYLNLITNPIIWDFIFGVLIGLLFVSKRVNPILSSNIILVLLIISFTVVVLQYFIGFNLGHGPSKSGGFMAIFILFTMLYVKNIKIKVSSPLVWLGKISYSLYLIHFPIQTLLVQLLINSSHPRFAKHPLLFFILVPLSLFSASISCKFLETKLSGWLRKKIIMVFQAKKLLNLQEKN